FGLLQPLAPHEVAVPCGERTVTLAEGQFSAVELRHGRVVRFRATPVRRHLTPAEAVAHAALVEEALAGGGFVASERAADVLADLERADRARVSAWQAPFGSASWRAEVWIVVAARGGTRLAELLRLESHGCLVSVELWDAALTAQPR